MGMANIVAAVEFVAEPLRRAVELNGYSTPDASEQLPAPIVCVSYSQPKSLTPNQREEILVTERLPRPCRRKRSPSA